MGISKQIEQILHEAIQPESLEVINESHLHAGHAGDDGTGESHFRIVIVAERFDGMSRIARHRMINELLDEALPYRPHALSINARAPDETARG